MLAQLVIMLNDPASVVNQIVTSNPGRSGMEFLLLAVLAHRYYWPIMRLLSRAYRRWQLLRHTPWHWELRRGTIDRRLFRDVVIRNEYQLPSRFGEDDVLVDVGAHTGAFAYAALRRGAGRVFCCEAGASNFRILERNLRGFSLRVRLLHCAVWRNDVAVTELPFANLADQRNTGAGAVSEYGDRVPALSFDALVDQVSER